MATTDGKVLARLILVQKFNSLDLEKAVALRRAQKGEKKKHTTLNTNPHLPKPVRSNHGKAVAALERSQLLTCPPSIRTKILYLSRTCHISMFELMLSQPMRSTTNQQPNV
jgi:hypothetical protein